MIITLVLVIISGICLFEIEWGSLTVAAALAIIDIFALFTLYAFWLKRLNKAFLLGVLLYITSTLTFLFQEWITALVLFITFTGITLISWGILETPKNTQNNQADNSPFSELRENLTSAISESEIVSSKLQHLEDKMEVYAAENWKKQTESEEKYADTITDVIQLLDNYHTVIKNSKKTEEIDWLYQRTCQILKDRGIIEIPVNKGDPFNGKYHKCVGRQFDSIPKGCISQIIRNGYFFKAQKQEDDIVFRETNVIVSNLQSDETAKLDEGK